MRICGAMQGMPRASVGSPYQLVCRSPGSMSAQATPSPCISAMTAPEESMIMLGGPVAAATK